MKRKLTYAGLKRKADAVFSEFVRKRWADSNGETRCVTCRNKAPWRQLQCGHFVSRVHLATRWLPENAAPQCSSCNVLRRGNLAEYAAWLQAEYGHGIIERLVEMKRKSVKYTRADLEALIENYRQNIEGLEAVRSFDPASVA